MEGRQQKIKVSEAERGRNAVVIAKNAETRVYSLDYTLPTHSVSLFISQTKEQIQN